MDAYRLGGRGSSRATMIPAPSSVLFVSGSAASATLRYRVRLPEENLRSRGIRTAALHFTDPRIRHLAPRADVVVLYRCPAGRDLVELIGQLRRSDHPPLIVYDVDDLVFAVDHCLDMSFLSGWSAGQRTVFEREVALRSACIQLADVMTGSTEGVLAELRRLSPVPAKLLPNGIGRIGLTDADAALRRPRPTGVTRIGYFSGSATHDEDWATIEPVVVEALSANPELRLWLVGQVQPSRAIRTVSRQVRAHRAVSWRELPNLLRQVDINLAPLARNRFTDAKSAIKWLEAALVETPTIATGSPSFLDSIADGRTGFLADSPEEWLAHLQHLTADRAERIQVGTAARSAALNEYSPEIQMSRLLAIWTEGKTGSGATMDDVHDSTPPSWRPAPVLLQPYPWPHGTETVALDLPTEALTESRALERAAQVAKFRSRALSLPRKLPRRVLAVGRRLIESRSS